MILENYLAPLNPFLNAVDAGAHPEASYICVRTHLIKAGKTGLKPERNPWRTKRPAAETLENKL